MIRADDRTRMWSENNGGKATTTTRQWWTGTTAATAMTSNDATTADLKWYRFTHMIGITPDGCFISCGNHNKNDDTTNAYT